MFIEREIKDKRINKEDKMENMDNRYERMATMLGMTVTERNTVAGVNTFVAEITMERGTITIHCGENGTARIDKPNGTHKWYYEKSTGQLRSVIKQVMNFWK